MAREPSVESIMPSSTEVRALLDEHGVVHAPHGSSQPLGPVGLLAAMAVPPPPPMSFWGWLGRDPCGARVGHTYIERMAGESLDEFRLRLQYAHGGPGQIAHFTYARGTK